MALIIYAEAGTQGQQGIRRLKCPRVYTESNLELPKTFYINSPAGLQLYLWAPGPCSFYSKDFIHGGIFRSLSTLQFKAMRLNLTLFWTNVSLVQFNGLRGCRPGDVSAGWSYHRRYDRGDTVMSKVAVTFSITNCLTTRVRWLLVPKEERQMTSRHRVRSLRCAVVLWADFLKQRRTDVTGEGAAPVI